MKLPAPSKLIKQSWAALHRVPGGKAAFSRIIGRTAPYTGTVGATITELRHGYSRGELVDRRAVRNHLGSVHAIALANFGEMVSGVAMLYSLPEDMRAILTGLHVEYVKKSRGLLSATCEIDVPSTRERQTVELLVEIRDAEGQLTCRVRPVWLIGPIDR
jgi:acyl-coenzyme A thioesterase PaaI-like protein